MRASPSAGNLRSGPGELSARPEKFSDRDGPAQRNFETESARSQMAEISNTGLESPLGVENSIERIFFQANSATL